MTFYNEKGCGKKKHMGAVARMHFVCIALQCKPFEQVNTSVRQSLYDISFLPQPLLLSLSYGPAAINCAQTPKALALDFAQASYPRSSY